MRETDFTESLRSFGKETVEVWRHRAGITAVARKLERKGGSEFDELMTELTEAIEEFIYWTDQDYELNHGRKNLLR